MTDQIESDKNPAPQMNKVSDIEALDENQVAQFLTQVSDFFTRHDELLEELIIPHQAGGTVSLVEKQLTLLRNRKQQLEEQIRTLVDIARDNERLSRHIHALSVDLIQTESLDDLVATTRHHLVEKLKIDDMSLFIIDPDHRIEQDEAANTNSVRYIAPNSANMMMFSHFMADRTPVCGQVTPDHVEFLFKDRAKMLRSVAIVPLVHGRDFGVLALGSYDPKRFTVDKGGHFLGQLAELLSASLQRYI